MVVEMSSCNRLFSGGRLRSVSLASVSPYVKVDGIEDGEDVASEMATEDCEKITLPKEDERIIKIVDPKLPSQEEVDRHYLMGHLPYRKWCPVCTSLGLLWVFLGVVGSHFKCDKIVTQIDWPNVV